MVFTFLMAKINLFLKANVNKSLNFIETMSFNTYKNSKASLFIVRLYELEEYIIFTA